jgi:hypothetical protein
VVFLLKIIPHQPSCFVLFCVVAYIRNSSKAELWVVNLDSSNGSSKVPGNRDLGWQDENPSMNKTQMSVATHSDVENVDGSESTEAQGGPCHQIGGGAPQKQINTRARDLKSRDDRTIPEGWKIKKRRKKKEEGERYMLNKLHCQVDKNRER